MSAGLIATQWTTPVTTRAYTVTVCSVDVTGDTQWDSLSFEDQGTSAQGTASFRLNRALGDLPEVIDQGLVTIEDHVAGGIGFRGFIDSRRPARAPSWSEIDILASGHTSLLDNVIPFEQRPAGESDAARIGYLWGLYAGEFLQGSLAYVQQVSASLPEQIFAGVSLRQALDLIAAQASSSAVWYLDTSGRLHYFAAETNDAPLDVTSDTPGGGECAPLDLDIDYDSKSYNQAVYVRGKTDAGSGWVYSQAARLAHNGLRRTTFFDAPDCTTSAMRNALGQMYLGRVGSAVSRGSFSVTSADADGWRAGQNVTVRSTHIGNLNESFRIARVRTQVMGPYAGKTAGLRKYEVEFGGSRAGQSTGGSGPVVGTGLVGDILDDGGNLLLGSGNDAATSGFGAAIRRYITSGIYNSDFSLTPPYPDATIVQAYNPLPFWTFTQLSGTVITVTSVREPAYGSGRILRFDMAAGAAGDDSYIEQIIPIVNGASQTFYHMPVATVIKGATVSLAEVYLSEQYLTVDGTATGSEKETSIETNSGGWANPGPGGRGDLFTAGTLAPPADAYFMRVRFGFRRATAATSVTEEIYLADVHLTNGGDYEWIAERWVPGTYEPGLLTQVDGSLTLAANAGPSGYGAALVLNGQTGDLSTPGTLTVPLTGSTTPTINNPGTATFANRACKWVKIGRLVVFTISWDVTALGSNAGTVTVTGTGLPEIVAGVVVVGGARSIASAASLLARAGNVGGELSLTEIYVNAFTGAITGTSLVDGSTFAFAGAYIAAS